MNNRISVIVPCLNEAQIISHFLLDHQYLRIRGHELILVDGGSTDNTRELVQGLCDQILTAPKGRALQQNKGAAHASGNWLLFLHADTRLPQPCFIELEQLMDYFDYGWGRFDVTLDSTHWLLKLVGRMMNLRSRFSGIATGDQAIFVKQEMFAKIGGFAPLALMEDIDLSARLKKITRPFCSQCKVITSARRWQKNGILRTIVSMWWYRFLFFCGKDTQKLALRYYSQDKIR